MKDLSRSNKLKTLMLIIIVSFLLKSYSSFDKVKISNSQINVEEHNNNIYEEYVLIEQEEQNIIITSPWNTPYFPEYFVNRVELKNKIQTKLQQDTTQHTAILVGVHGLGGVGKTYIALDIIYNPRKNYNFRGWFTATDENHLKADYCKLGDDLGLLKDGMKEQEKIDIVKNWLNNQENLLLVFDNAPNMEIIEKYLPYQGDIIITSRNYNLPDVIEMDVMEDTEAIELLKPLISESCTQDEYIILARELGYLPLAISQAGAYIRANKITIEKYLQLYKNEQDTLMSNDVMPVTHKHIPVFITWNIILKEIQEQDKTGKAIELLRLASFCHFVDIPKLLLMHHLYGTVDSKTEIEFNKIIVFLRQYSLIKVTPDTIALHHLVQDCVRFSMNLHTKDMVLKKAIDTIKGIYPLEKKNLYDYDLVKMLLPQMETLLLYIRKYLDQVESVELIEYTANAYYELGNYQKAKILLEEALKFNENHYGYNHIRTSNTLQPLGEITMWLGNYIKAKELLENALKIRVNYYRTRKHIKVLPTLKWLGIGCLWIGDYPKAKTLLEETLEIQENYYGTREHIQVAHTISYLGRANLELGDYHKAKILLESAAEIQEKHAECPKYIEKTMNLRSLGLVYLKLGDYYKAETLLKEELGRQINYFHTRKHIQVAVSLRFLSRAYLRLGNYQKAKALLEEALKIQQNYYGTHEQIEVAYTLRFLGKAFLELDDYQKAKALLEEALKIQQNYYNTHKHIQLTFILRALGKTYLELKDYQKAKTYLEEALEIQENYYGVNHLEVANTLIIFAQLQYKLRDYTNALSLVDRASKILQHYPDLNRNHNTVKRVTTLRQVIICTVE